MKVSLTPIEKITPYKKNARTHSEKQIELLANAIAEFGFDQPIVVDRWNVVIKGHGRLLAAQKLGLETVPVVVADQLSPAQVRAARLADNRISELSEWDADLLSVELKDLFVEDFDLSSLGFDDISFDLSDEDIEYPVSSSVVEAIKEISDRREEVETRIQEAPATPPREVIEVKEDDFKPPEEEDVKTNIVLGDLFEIGKHRLLCGSSTNAKDVKRLINGGDPYLMITDPPYGVNYDASWRTEAGINKEWQNVATGMVMNDDNVDWTEAWMLTPASVGYVWHGGVHAAVVATSLIAAEFTIRSQIIWAKPSLVMGRGHYHWRHEPCWYAVKKGATAKWIGDRKQNTVWDIPNMHVSQGNVDDGKTIHSTQKPVACMANAIKNHEGDVHDPFCGSGSTMVAAHQLDRRCYGMELSPVYCQVIVERMIKLDPTLTIKKNGVDVTNSFRKCG